MLGPQTKARKELGFLGNLRKFDFLVPNPEPVYMGELIPCPIPEKDMHRHMDALQIGLSTANGNSTQR